MPIIIKKPQGLKIALMEVIGQSTKARFGRHKKRMDFINEMMDLLHSYQDVITAQEAGLFPFYEQEAKDLIKKIKESNDGYSW